MKNDYLLKKLNARRAALAQPFVVFDVGANYGDETLGLTVHDAVHVHAFEPIPDLVDGLRAKARGNYFVNQCAVDLSPGVKKFGVSRTADMGTSSLNSFNSDVGSLGMGDPARFRFDEFLEVRCIRLDNYIKDSGVCSINFIKIDCQGHDLVVLKSLGEKIGIVEAGVLEVARLKHLRLYEDGPSRREAAEFLWGNGFRVVASVPNDVKNIEQNLFFEKTARSSRIWFWLYYFKAVACGFPCGLIGRLRTRIALRTRMRAFLSFVSRK